MIVTTTSTIEGAKITRYIGLISEHVVIGSWFGSDFLATFTDAFGAFSRTYEDKLSKIKSRAMDELTRKARQKGANCIVGASVDVDEITGGGKQMFMITAAGTAVVLDQEPQSSNPVKNILASFTQSQLDKIASLESLVRRIEGINSYLAAEHSKKILEEHTEYFDISHLRRIVEAYLKDSSYLSIESIRQFDLLVEKDQLRELVYSLLSSKDAVQAFSLMTIYSEAEIFDQAKTMSLLSEDETKIGGFVSTFLARESYDQSTIAEIEKLKELLITQFPENVEILEKKGRWVCRNEHKVRLELKECETCGYDRRGMKAFEKALENLESQIRKIKIAYNMGD